MGGMPGIPGIPGMPPLGQAADPLYGYFYAVAGAVSALIIYSIIIINKVIGANIIWLNSISTVVQAVASYCG